MPGFSSQPEQLKFDFRDKSITPEEYCMGCFRPHYGDTYRVTKPHPARGFAATIERGVKLQEPQEEMCFVCAWVFQDPTYCEHPLTEILRDPVERQRFLVRAEKTHWLFKHNHPAPLSVRPQDLDAEIARLKQEEAKPI